MSDIVQQLNIWEQLLPYKQISKPIRLIEFFGGIGSQFKALKKITDKVESWKYCEWQYQSVAAYNAIHIKDFSNYAEGKNREELLDYLQGKISTDYKEPCDCSKKPMKWLAEVYNNCIATKNLINIMSVHGKDLEIVDTDKYEYILTYSFPCTDLSLAGKRLGMSISQANGGTRSGLLWEVERILNELDKEHLPQILLMENVPEITRTSNLKDFLKWTKSLENMGYKNYFEILNAKDYGIPQNRRRVFMVSILGNYNYSFPIKLRLRHKLKDFLEEKVNEKYYLSQKMVKYISAYNEKWTGNNGGSIINKDIGCTINTAPGQRRCDASNYVSNDLPNNYDLKGGLPIIEDNKQGYRLAQDGDGIDISNRMTSHRGTVQKGIIQTIQANSIQGVCVKDELILIGTLKQKFESSGRIYSENGIAPTINTMGGGNLEPKVALLGGFGNKKNNQFHEQNRIYDGNQLASSIPANKEFHPFYTCNLRVRKLTPKECIRLMGFQDKDYQAMVDNGLSSSSIYHMAGDSIVVPVLMGIFSKLFNNDDKHIELINDYVEGIKEDEI